MIVGEKMDCDHCRDLGVDEENFEENNLIEIEGLRVRHGKQFVDSKKMRKGNEKWRRRNQVNYR